MVDFMADDTPELKAWRQEVRSFLETELPSGMYFDYDYNEQDSDWAAYLEFWRKVGAKGWVALTWPKEYYGQGRSAIEHYIMQEEFSRYGVPSYPVIGIAVASAILRLGTHEQRLRHLKGIAEATTLWGEGYTEPQAGSDLASLTTRAHRDGDYWVLNGQKTLGTAAHKCQWMAVLARSDAGATRHNGISCFMVPLDTPGIEMLPMHNMADGQQNQTFFDNVRIPADCLLGTEGEAWNEVWFGMGGDDITGWGPNPDPWVCRIERNFRIVLDHVRTAKRDGHLLKDDPAVRTRIAELALGIEKFKLQTREAFSNWSTKQMRTGNPVLVNHLHQAYFKEFWPEFAQACMELVGPSAQLSGPTEHYFRASFGNHAGGTSQLKRMVMATRGLGLPR